jgi:hypothetical protein
VVALTEATAAIRSSTGAVTIYRRFHKPALEPPRQACRIMSGVQASDL